VSLGRADPLPRAAWVVIAAAVPLHLLLALATDLSPDEAYYLCAARSLGSLPAIPDHPPLIMWLLALSDRLTVLPIELRVRIWPIAFSACVAAACVTLAGRRGAGRSGCIAAAWLAAFGLLPTAGAFIATPDMPLGLAVLAGLLWAGDEGDRRPGPVVAGLAAAFGALAKVVAPVLALVTAATAAPRSLARRLAFIAPSVVALPLLLPSLRFQFRHAFTEAPGLPWSPMAAAGALGAAIGAQVLLGSPWAFARGVRALAELPLADRALVWTMTLLVGASAIARGIPPEPNWWAPATLVIIVAAACSADDLAPRARVAMLAFAVAPTLVAAAHTIHPFLPIPRATDPTARLHGWREPRGPTNAPGVGAYGAAAERCVYRADCESIHSYFNGFSESSSRDEREMVRP
jgi:hypothetical protein